MRSRGLALAALATACGVAIALLATFAVVRAQNDRAASDRAVRAARPTAEKVLSSGRPFAVVRALDRKHGASYGRMAVAPLSGTTVGEALPVGPSCSRTAFAADRGICLGVLGTEMSVEVVDADLQVVHRLSLPGIPSRSRVSPDGRWGGVTAFIVGHAYAAPGQFSTAATVLDLRSGKVVGSLEKDFEVFRDGKLVDARDRNYWGLTFAADGDTFYATLASGGRTWLIKGSVRKRRAHTVHDNVECPSLSPDGTRIGYKKAVAHDPTEWRFHVLDLATGKETALAERRSIDDQLSWLDDEHLLYADGERTYAVNADGSGAPRLWLGSADSPTVQPAVR